MSINIKMDDKGMWNSQATEFNEAAMSINTNKSQKHNSEQKKVHIV